MTPAPMSRRRFALLLGLGATVTLLPRAAVAAKARVFTGLVKGVAIGGYDPVAYFSQGKPTRGSKQFTVEHQGVTWRFSSAANRDAFKVSPGRYAPQYGGYCAWAVSQGYTAKGDPRAWSIVGGRLYLNYSTGVRKQWSRNASRNIARGNANWPGVLQ